MIHLPTRRRWLGALLAMGVAPAWSAGTGRSTTIELGLYDDPQEGVVWLAYAVSLVTWATSAGVLDTAPLGPLEPTFEGELSARRQLIVIWRELLQKEPRPMPYMDALTRVEDAGFLPEYVWTVHWRSSWKQPPPDLRIAEFYAWQRQSLVLTGHEPRTGSRVIVKAAAGDPAEHAASAASR